MTNTCWWLRCFHEVCLHVSIWRVFLFCSKHKRPYSCLVLHPFGLSISLLISTRRLGCVAQNDWPPTIDGWKKKPRVRNRGKKKHVHWFKIAWKGCCAIRRKASTKKRETSTSHTCAGPSGWIWSLFKSWRSNPAVVGVRHPGKPSEMPYMSKLF